MAWYNLGSSKLLGHVKLVLPGIIVSLIGGSAGILLFNNPGKIKGRSTLDAWYSVIQYEKIYDDNIITTTKYADFESMPGLKKYKGDVMHQIQMLSENFKNVKEENNIDNRLLAIINCKVDTYNQILNMTDVYLDSSLKLIENPAAYIPAENETVSNYEDKIVEASSNIMIEYTRQRQHLIDRDSSTINNILQQLTNSYTSWLYKFHFTTRLPDEFNTTVKKLYGSWEFLISGGGFTLEKNNSGTMEEEGDTLRGTWSFDNNFKFIFNPETKDSVRSFTVLNITDKTIRLAINDSMHFIGFRKSD